MNSTKTIYIKNPSASLTAFIENAQDRKRVRMEQLRNKLK